MRNYRVVVETEKQVVDRWTGMVENHRYTEDVKANNETEARAMVEGKIIEVWDMTEREERYKAQKKKETEKKARAKANREAREKAKAEEMGVTVEEYQEYVKAKRNYKRVAEIYKELKREMEEIENKMKYYENKMEQIIDK